MPDLTASPGRCPPPGPMPSNQHNSNMQRQGGGGQKEPVMLQGDFRKVSGISSEIFRQIEAVENDHDPSTAAALDVSNLQLFMVTQKTKRTKTVSNCNFQLLINYSNNIAND